MEAIDGWDILKQNIRISCLQAAKQGTRRRLSAKRRRIWQLRTSFNSAMATNNQPPYSFTKGNLSIEALADLFETMAIAPSQRVNRLRQELADAETEKHRWQRQAVFSGMLTERQVRICSFFS